MAHTEKHPHPPKKIAGEFQHFIFSPRGGIEGLMLKVDDEPMQFVVDPELGASLLSTELKSGQQIEVEAAPRKPSPKGESAHAVHELHRLLKIEGRKATVADEPTQFSGKVARLNYARHGEPNGVVLDSGDFIHMKPEGMAASGLKVGDAVKATGDASRLETGAGFVVEAHEVNGRKVKHKPPHAK